MRASIYFALLALPVLGGSLAGCQDNAYCFSDCGEGGQGGTAGANAGGAAGTAGAAGSISLGGAAGTAGTIGFVGGSAGVGGCVATTNPAEICDGLDNDCNGTVDDVPSEELGKVTSCGSCENNCLSKVLGATPSSITCTSGACGYTACTAGFFDADGDKTNGCEYACTPSATPTEVCDGLDNDCDGKKDEDTDFCSPASCGSCQPCPVGDYLHTVLTCVKIDATKDCRANDQTNAQCAIGTCLDGYIDRNGNPLDGCEFQCTPTADKTEICDGLDNDCDGLIDAEDPDLTDVAGTPDGEKLGTSCFGDPDGECAKPGREGVRTCVNAQKICLGDNVRTENQVAETCNTLDDDCDGTVDDTPTDAGSICGGQNGVSVGLCLASVLTCIEGKLECPGAVLPDPTGDACDGSDNDCDDIIDGTRQSPDKTCATDADCDDGDPATVEGCLPRASNPSQKLCAFLPKVPQPVGSDCLVPPPVTQPAGTTAVSGCQKGAWACQGGSPVCAGAVEATPAAVDSCNIDRNCDGTYDGVVLDFSNDSQNCGACGNVCTPPAGSNQLYVCQDSKCVAAPGGTCLPGYQTCEANNPCGYACVKTSNTEICNGIDDDCNCAVDDNVANPPAPKAVCGTADPAQLTDNNCKPKTAGNPNGITVVCQNAAWRCQFGAAGYCDPDNNPTTPAACPAAADPCDGKDNNCNGQADDSFLIGQSGLGQPCASDDGKPAPGDGACRRTGTYVCRNDGTGTQCNAVKGACSENPGGCEEVCDGLDNDCDGSIDETFKAKGSNATYFLKPAAVKIKNISNTAGTFMFAYEASRPDADDEDSGSGNGYSTNPPPGVAADRTLSCSRGNVLPWSDVTPREAAQTCGLAGGRLCTLNEWQRTCRVNNNDGSGPNTPDTDNNCTYGFGPVGSCKNAPDATNRVCNIGAFDYNTSTDGDQDGLLPTASPKLKACYADWGGYNGGTSSQRAYDITGNLREISICQNDRAICSTANDANACANTCCSGTSTQVGSSTTRLCGTLGTNLRRLSGQPCAVNADCCNNNLNCGTTNGYCTNDSAGQKYCSNTNVASCRDVGVACTADAQCCGGERCQGGLCGGPGTLSGATYPLLGGSFATDADTGLTCDFDFYKVAGGFQLFDTGFRCCFDSDPTK